MADFRTGSLERSRPKSCKSRPHSLARLRSSEKSVTARNEYSSKLKDIEEKYKEVKSLKEKDEQPTSRNNVRYTYETGDQIFWTINLNTGRKLGTLVFKCRNIDNPLEQSVASKNRMAFKFTQSDSKLIKLLMDSHGIREASGQGFNLHWGNTSFCPGEMRALHEWQKINHFPRSSELTRKDRLYMNIRRMQRQCGLRAFDFIPNSFILPTEYKEFCDTNLREKGTWIVKPVSSSRGKGIYLTTGSGSGSVNPDETALVCRYLDSPLLVNGYKSDLRLYVLVTSIDPLVLTFTRKGWSASPPFLITTRTW